MIYCCNNIYELRIHSNNFDKYYNILTTIIIATIVNFHIATDFQAKCQIAISITHDEIFFLR